MALIKYIPRLETVEVKTALEIAEEEYRRAVDEAAKWNKISCTISNKCGEYNDELESLNKEFRNLAGRYKRSTKNDTRASLYYQMLVLRRRIEATEPAVDWLQQMYDKASAQYIRECTNELTAKRNVVNAREAAGLKFGVYVNLQKVLLSSDVKTIADAVSFICQNANGLVNWLIYTESVNGLTTRRNIIAESKILDSEIFFALIKKYGDSTAVIDAEIAAPQKSTALHFDTPADEFKAIAFHAMHYFTLDDFVTPISELHEFIERTGYAAAKDELAEWIELATNNGVEVPAEFIETPAAETPTETIDNAVAQISKFGVSVITSKPNKRGALICYVDGKKISYQRAEELYRHHFGDGKVIWCYGLSDAETAERIKQALANNPFAVETFSLAPVDLPDAEEFASDKIIHSTQFAVCAVTKWLLVVKHCEKIISEWKNVPDFYGNETFNLDEFIRQALNHHAASLRQNISKLKAGITILAVAGYLQRAEDFISCLVRPEERLDFP